MIFENYQQVFAMNLLSVVSPLSPPTNIFLQHKIIVLIFKSFGILGATKTQMVQ